MNFQRKKDYFKETLKDYLSFSKNERRGLFVIIIIFLLLITAKLAIRLRHADNSQIVLSDFSKNVSVSASSKKTDVVSSVSAAQILSMPAKQTYSERKPVALFNFNPNGLPEEDWKRLGFAEKQIRVIKNYEAKGGRFYSKEDLKKIYSISQSDYERVEPYIVIPPRENRFHPKPFDAALKVDIGTADTTELKKLRGIGTSYANRIVKYRAKLGGFHSVSQLHEVWGMNDSLFNVIVDHVYISDSNNINRININTAAMSELKSHPYFNYNLANTLINYRNQHGAFKNLADIRRMPLVDDSIYRKIAPYLKID